jgi:hypothetical protein
MSWFKKIKNRGTLDLTTEQNKRLLEEAKKLDSARLSSGEEGFVNLGAESSSNLGVSNSSSSESSTDTNMFGFNMASVDTESTSSESPILSSSGGYSERLRISFLSRLIVLYTKRGFFRYGVFKRD